MISILGAFLATFVVLAQAATPAPPPIIGRWDLTVRGTGGDRSSWLEVRHSGIETLIGQFVGTSGSARPISKVEFKDGEFRFTIPPQWDRVDGDLVVVGRIDADHLKGTMKLADRAAVEWTGVRAPSLRRAAEPQWGTAVPLLTGKDLAGWHAMGGTNEWEETGGVLHNRKSGANLVTDRTFDDFKLHVELNYPKGSNSGVYLRGRYEVQIADIERDDTGGMGVLGAVYGFLSPNQHAARNAGDWQTFDITLVGRLVTVVLNGKRIICEQEIPGITGAALDSKEGEPGPLLLQGDHGPIDYRNITVTPAKPSGSAAVR